MASVRCEFCKKGVVLDRVLVSYEHPWRKNKNKSKMVFSHWNEEHCEKFKRLDPRVFSESLADYVAEHFEEWVRDNQFDARDVARLAVKLAPLIAVYR